MNNNSNENKTKLSQKYAFWYRISDEALQGLGPKVLNQNEYENQVKKIADFETVIIFLVHL
jgi:hypothetical protein